MKAIFGIICLLAASASTAPLRAAEKPSCVPVKEPPKGRLQLWKHNQEKLDSGEIECLRREISEARETFLASLPQPDPAHLGIALRLQYSRFEEVYGRVNPPEDNTGSAPKISINRKQAARLRSKVEDILTDTARIIEKKSTALLPSESRPAQRARKPIHTAPPAENSIPRSGGESQSLPSGGIDADLDGEEESLVAAGNALFDGKTPASSADETPQQEQVDDSQSLLDRLNQSPAASIPPRLSRLPDAPPNPDPNKPSGPPQNSASKEKTSGLIHDIGRFLFGTKEEREAREKLREEREAALRAEGKPTGLLHDIGRALFGTKEEIQERKDAREERNNQLEAEGRPTGIVHDAGRSIFGKADSASE